MNRFLVQLNVILFCWILKFMYKSCIEIPIIYAFLRLCYFDGFDRSHQTEERKPIKDPIVYFFLFQYKNHFNRTRIDDTWLIMRLMPIELDVFRSLVSPFHSPFRAHKTVRLENARINYSISFFALKNRLK